MNYISRKLSMDNRALFEEYGINHTQFQVLIYLNFSEEHGEKVCQKSIENEIKMRASSVSTMLAILEKNSFIERYVDENDARTKFITLTDKGREICNKSKHIIDKCDERISSILTEDEINSLKSILAKIIENID